MVRPNKMVFLSCLICNSQIDMTRIIGELKEVDGELCIKMQISPQNLEEFDVPIKEVLEEFINKRIVLEVFPSEPRWGNPTK